MYQVASIARLTSVARAMRHRNRHIRFHTLNADKIPPVNIKHNIVAMVISFSCTVYKAALVDMTNAEDSILETSFL